MIWPAFFSSLGVIVMLMFTVWTRAVKLHREGCQLHLRVTLAWWQFSRLILHQIGWSWHRRVEDILAELHTKFGEFWWGFAGVIVEYVWSNETSRSDLKNSGGLFLVRGTPCKHMLRTGGQNLGWFSELRLPNLFWFLPGHFGTWFGQLSSVVWE